MMRNLFEPAVLELETSRTCSGPWGTVLDLRYKETWRNIVLSAETNKPPILVLFQEEQSHLHDEDLELKVSYEDTNRLSIPVKTLSGRWVLHTTNPTEVSRPRRFLILHFCVISWFATSPWISDPGTLNQDRSCPHITIHVCYFSLLMPHVVQLSGPAVWFYVHLEQIVQNRTSDRKPPDGRRGSGRAVCRPQNGLWPVRLRPNTAPLTRRLSVHGHKKNPKTKPENCFVLLLFSVYSEGDVVCEERCLSCWHNSSRLIWLLPCDAKDPAFLWIH